jgi:hypothetical protein
MGAASDVGAADVVVYVDHSDVDLSRIDELKRGIRRVVSFIEANEPQLIAYGFHVDEGRGRMAVTAVHPDSASLELHMDVGREAFRTLGDLITLTRIEVYGSVSERVRGLLEQKAQMLGAGEVVVIERFAGFVRSAQNQGDVPTTANS